MNDRSSSSSANWPSPTHGDALKSKGTIRFIIEDFAVFADSSNWPMRYSEPVFICGLPWSLRARITSTKRLEIALYCNVHDGVWSCRAIYGIKLVAQEEGKLDSEPVIKQTQFSATVTQTINRTNNSAKLLFDRVENLMDPENGWYDPDTDTIIVEAEINAELPQSDKRMAITQMEMERLEGLKNQMNNLLVDGEKTDAHFFLVGDEKELLSAHQNILISASDVFKTMFNETWNQNESIEVTDIEPGAFRVMLNFIYTGDPHGLNWHNLFDVLYAANKYIITRLEKFCVNCLANMQLEVRSVLFVLGQAQLLEKKYLAGRCWRYIDSNVYAVVKAKGFLEIDRNLLDELLGRDTLAMSKKPEGEIVLWDAAIRWADEQCRQNGLECTGQNQRQMLGMTLFKIRVPLIGKSDLEEKIVPSGVLTQEELITIVFSQLNTDSQYDRIMSGIDGNGKYQLKFPTGLRA